MSIIDEVREALEDLVDEGGDRPSIDRARRTLAALEQYEVVEVPNVYMGLEGPVLAYEPYVSRPALLLVKKRDS